MNQTAEYSAGYATGHVVSVILMLALPIVIGYFVGDRLAKKRGIVGNVKWPIRVGFCISLLLLLAYCAGDTSPIPAKENSSNG